MVKVLSLLVLSLPPLVTIFAFAFALVSTLSKDWAHYDQLSTASGADLSLPANQTVLYRIHRGLLQKCSVGTSDETNSTVPIEVCTHFSLLGRGAHSSCDPSTGGNDHLCQLIHLSTNLMATSCILLGIALILHLVLFGLSFSTISLRGAFLLPASKTSQTSPASSGTIPTVTIINLPTTILLLTSTICAFLGQIIGLHALTDEQRSQGDWIVTGSDPSDITPWVMGSGGLGYGTAAWVLSGAAGLIGLCVWGVPRMGWVRADGGVGGLNGVGGGDGVGNRNGGMDGDDGIRRVDDY